MSVRHLPRILGDSDHQMYPDGRKGDYTKIRCEINYCKINHMHLPEKPGIYFFYVGDDLVYIGRAKNIRKRVGTHISINKHINNAFQPHNIDLFLHKVDRIEFELYPEDELDWIELFYMTRLGPSMNALSWKHAQIIESKS